MESPSFAPLALEEFHLESCETNLVESRLTFHLSSRKTSARCPLCQTLSHRVHSRYRRKLADLPCGIFQVTLKVRVGKFFCPDPKCERRIFTERLQEVAAPHARKTVRLIQRLQALGLALGGAAGARLAGEIGTPACGSTLLHHLQKLCLPEIGKIRILGVDDFAFRKGRQYGTILVDLEKHRPVALLADRKAETLTDWLVGHPEIEVLSRDRSKAYRGAMTRGLPDAIQVTDRFHLVQNLGETLEKVFSNYDRELKTIGQERQQTLESTGQVTVIPKPTASERAYARTLANHRRRVERQREIKRLHGEKWPFPAIAEMVGVSVRTVERFLASPDFPEIPPRRRSFGRGLLEPYKQSILEWWNGGIKGTERIMFLLQRKGYTGGERTLQRYLSSLRSSQGLPPRRAVRTDRILPPVRDPQSPPLTPRGAAYLILKRPENRDCEDTEVLARLAAIHPDVAEAIELAKGFLELIRQRRPDAFDAWLMAAFKSSLKPFVAFADGLCEDYAAVKASMTLNVSNGPVEGLNNRLKMLKRQMYGRAGLELLSKRFILA